jgi:arylsulfatase A-like enzyme
MGPYEPVHRVPLILKDPGAGRQGMEDGWVQLVDVMPTALEVAGLPPVAGVQGEVLPHVSHPILIEALPNADLARWFGHRFDKGYRGLYEGSWKLVSYSDGATELFDLDRDPGETTNLAPGHSALVREMNEKLDSYWKGLPRRGLATETDSDTRSRLKAAGYVE